MNAIRRIAPLVSVAVALSLAVSAPITTASARVEAAHIQGLGRVAPLSAQAASVLPLAPAQGRPMAELPHYGEFLRVAHGGFGDSRNAYAWAMEWFKGKLYVGTSRNNLCDANIVQRSPWVRTVTGCPTVSQGLMNLDSRAEIWAYTPQTGQWQLVYQSPMVNLVINGTVLRLPRDVGYRSMAVYTDRHGVTALYVGTVGGNRLANLLRTIDGVHFQALGPVGFNMSADSIRALTAFDGKLFVAPIGSSVQYLENPNRDKVFMTNDPASGKWIAVSRSGFGIPANGQIYTMAAFNNQLYAAISNSGGFQLWRTPGIGHLSFTWTPVLVYGGYRGEANPTVTAMTVFNDKLYIGTASETIGPNNRVSKAAELLAVNPDDSWNLIAGDARQTPEGFKPPISGLGAGFGDPFAVYLWDLDVFDGWLYAGTYDYRTFLLNIPPITSRKAGFGLWRSRDGVHWSAVTTNGFGNPYNYGVRTMLATPVGLFVGTANPFAAAPNGQGGTEIWLLPKPGGLSRPYGFAASSAPCPMAHCNPSEDNNENITIPTASVSYAWRNSQPGVGFSTALGCTTGMRIIVCSGTYGSTNSFGLGGYVRALDFDGDTLWDSGGLLTPFVAGGVPFVDSADNSYVSDNQSIVSFSPEGTVRWDVPNPGGNTIVSFNMLASGFLVGQVGVGSTGKGELLVINPETGGIAGSYSADDTVNGHVGVWTTPKTVAVSGNRVYSVMQFQAFDGSNADPQHQERLYAFDVDANGQPHPLWYWAYEGPTEGTPIVVPGAQPTIFFGGTGLHPGDPQHVMMFAVKDLGSSAQFLWSADLTASQGVPYPTSTGVVPGIQTAAAHDPRGGVWVWSELDSHVYRFDDTTGRLLETISIPDLTGDHNANPDGVITIATNGGQPIMIIGVLGGAGRHNGIAAIDLTNDPPHLLWVASLDTGLKTAPYGQSPLVETPDGTALLVVPTFDGVVHGFILS